MASSKSEKDNATKKMKENRFGALLFIAINFLILFTAYNSGQNMITQVYKDLSYLTLGNFILFSNAIGSFIGCPMAPAIVKRLGFKLSLFFGCLSYVAPFMFGVFVCYCTRLDPSEQPFQCKDRDLIYAGSTIFGGLNGFLSSVLFCAQPGYISALCDESKRGSYFGWFWSIFQSSYFFGNILSLVVFKFFDTFTYFVTLFVFGVISTALFLLLPNIEENVSETLERESLTVSAVSKDSESQISQTGPPEERNEHLSIINQVKLIGQIATEKDIHPLCTQMILSGIIIAMQCGYLPRIIEEVIGNVPQKEVCIAEVMIVLGIAEMLTGISFGYFADRVDKKTLLRVSNLCTGIAFASSFAAIYYKHLAFCYIAAFFFGSSDNSVQTMVSTIVSKDWEGCLECFALGTCMQSLGCFLGFVTEAILVESNTYIFPSICLPFLALALGYTLRLPAGKPVTVGKYFTIKSQ